MTPRHTTIIVTLVIPTAIGALLGALQFSLAFIASVAVSYFHNGTAAPMTVTIGVLGLISLLVSRLNYKFIKS